jgi:hypothetical protein
MKQAGRPDRAPKRNYPSPQRGNPQLRLIVNPKPLTAAPKVRHRGIEWLFKPLKFANPAIKLAEIFLLPRPLANAERMTMPNYDPSNIEDIEWVPAQVGEAPIRIPRQFEDAIPLLKNPQLVPVEPEVWKPAYIGGPPLREDPPPTPSSVNTRSSLDVLDVYKRATTQIQQEYIWLQDRSNIWNRNILNTVLSPGPMPATPAYDTSLPYHLWPPNQADYWSYNFVSDYVWTGYGFETVYYYEWQFDNLSYQLALTQYQGDLNLFQQQQRIYNDQLSAEYQAALDEYYATQETIITVKRNIATQEFVIEPEARKRAAEDRRYNLNTKQYSDQKSYGRTYNDALRIINKTFGQLSEHYDFAMAFWNNLEYADGTSPYNRTFRGAMAAYARGEVRLNTLGFLSDIVANEAIDTIIGSVSERKRSAYRTMGLFPTLLSGFSMTPNIQFQGQNFAYRTSIRRLLRDGGLSAEFSKQLNPVGYMSKWDYQSTPDYLSMSKWGKSRVDSLLNGIQSLPRVRVRAPTLRVSDLTRAEDPLFITARRAGLIKPLDMPRSAYYPSHTQ